MKNIRLSSLRCNYAPPHSYNLSIIFSFSWRFIDAIEFLIKSRRLPITSGGYKFHMIAESDLFREDFHQNTFHLNASNTTWSESLSISSRYSLKGILIYSGFLHMYCLIHFSSSRSILNAMRRKRLNESTHELVIVPCFQSRWTLMGQVEGRKFKNWLEFYGVLWVRGQKGWFSSRKLMEWFFFYFISVCKLVFFLKKHNNFMWFNIFS